MRVFLIVISVMAVLYVLLCGALYFKQEKLLFAPTHLPAGYRFQFPGRFEEKWTVAPDGIRLHSLLFKAVGSKGVILYLHGNGGALNSWGDVAATYTALHYDVLLLDYRGYGKSGGTITSQAQLLTDVDAVYRQLLTEYSENCLVVLGYSLGSGPATWLAARHHPKLLILQAPYFSMRDMATRLYPYIPSFVLRYPMTTNKFISQVRTPIVIFHGDRDKVIYYGSAQKLKLLLKPNDQLITLPGAGHDGITNNTDYRSQLTQVLR